ncbi:MAG: fructokinase [Pseudonocardiales bacterium]|jgi:fructokinase|nr:fructokinase [Pseudonocardiales bacterium]
MTAGPGPEILVIGEALVDVVRTSSGDTYSHPGGSPANVAVGLARLGTHPALLTRLGRDADARVITDHLAANDVALLPVVDNWPTNLAEARVDHVGNAGYEFRLHWELPHDVLRDVDLASLRCVHTGSIAATQPPGADTVHDLVAELHRSATVSYDPNCRPTLMGDPLVVRRRVEALVEYADIVKASNEDLAFLYPDVEVTDTARRWAAAGPALVVLTEGASGYRAWNGAGSFSGSAVTVVVEDTVGAGDSFTSALLAGLHRRGLLGATHRDELRDLRHHVLGEVLHEAATAAAITCSRAGADPPTEAELAAYGRSAV